METTTLVLGSEEPPGAAFAASGCSSMLDFLSSPLLCNGAVQRVHLSGTIARQIDRQPGWLYIPARHVRDAEEAREAGSFARFLHALPLSFTELLLAMFGDLHLEELSELCRSIGSPNCTLLKLTCLTYNNRSHVTHLLKDALFNNTSLRSLEFYIDSADFPADACLIPALTRRSPCSSITHLHLHLRRMKDVSGILTLLAHNTISLTNFCINSLTNTNFIFSEISNRTPDIDSCRELATMLSTNTSLHSFSLHGSELPGEAVHFLFASLEKNAHLTSLSLHGCTGPVWPTASFVLDSLRVNGMLSELDLRSTPLEGHSEAAIQAQLARNRQRVEQRRAVLKAEGSALVPPTTVRLFLCGLPYSGKTTLSRSLVRWETPLSNSVKCLPCARKSRLPDRTRGIQVSTIQKDGVKVSLWDMAGQEEYYAFHDQMFPDLSADATPSLFLFVWNPIQLHGKSTGQEMKDERGKNITKTLDMFEDEFRYWLRFITSKTLKSFKFKPKLFVAITRADLLQINTKSRIINTFNKCQNDFQEHIQFDWEGVFEMNARDPCDAKDLALYIFNCTASILKSRPLVYQACNQARTLLPELVLSKPLPPLMTKGEFFDLCHKHLGLDSIQIQEAVALSLTETGDLIYFKTLELVVVNTQWFCHHFMGDLLHFGNNRYQHKGFFSPQFLESLLVGATMQRGTRWNAYRTILNANATSSPTIKGEALVKLLIGLHLACPQDDGQVNSDIFIPASLCTIPRKHVDPCTFLKGDEGNIKTFMGRRLKCKDPVCTFFTPGIFSFLQVTFKNVLSRVVVTLDEDVIAFCQNGVKVLVEFCKHEGRDHFIDVLIHSRHDLDNTIGWAYEEILDKMESICAQPRGIQGVQLVYEVIRPRSVKEFVCMEQRICVAVSLEELCKTLSHALEKRGTQPDCLKSVFYDWHPTNDSDCVIDLIGNVETLKVLKEYRQKFMLDVEDVLGINVGKESCSTSEPDQKKVFSSSISGIERSWIHDEILGARKDIQEVHKEIQNLVDDVRKLVHDVLPEVLQKVQELLTFAQDGEVGRLPRLFVVTTNDAGFVRKLVSAMVPGLQNVRLELLCEHRSRPHLVTEQRGIIFATLEDGLLKQGLPYINMFLKLASMAVKVGAHVAAGLGNTIPDFSRLIALVVDTPEFPSLSTYMDVQAPGASRINFQESQQWLFDVLSKHNCGSSTGIHEVFGLKRVRYRDSHVGWLCNEHCYEGEVCPI